MKIVDHDAVRPLQKRAPRKNAWTEAVRVRFLDALAATCNVRHAARAVGRDASGAYLVKRRNPAFAAAWADALAEGYQRLETELLAAALCGGTEPPEFDAEHARVETIDRDLAMKLLSRRQGGGSGHQRGGGQCGRVPIEEVEQRLLRQLDAIEKRLARRQ